MDLNEEAYMDALSGMTEKELKVEYDLVLHWINALKFNRNHTLYSYYVKRYECIKKYKEMCSLLGL